MEKAVEEILERFNKRIAKEKSWCGRLPGFCEFLAGICGISGVILGIASGLLFIIKKVVPGFLMIGFLAFIFDGSSMLVEHYVLGKSWVWVRAHFVLWYYLWLLVSIVITILGMYFQEMHNGESC